MNSIRDLAAAWNARESAEGVEAEHRSLLRGMGTPASDSSAPTSRSVLLIHGAGGSPADLLPLAEDLARCGVATFAPLLPAHGLGDEALGEIRFPSLVHRVLEAHDALAAASGRSVHVVGLSLGGILGIRLVTQRSAASLVALAPALRPFVVRRAASLAAEAVVHPSRALVKYRWQREVWRGIQATEPEIPRLTAPLLILHSRDDESVSVRGSRLLLHRAASSTKQLVLVDGQGHVLTQAPDPEVVFGPIRAFLGAHEDPPRES